MEMQNMNVLKEQMAETADFHSQQMATFWGLKLNVQEKLS